MLEHSAGGGETKFSWVRALGEKLDVCKPVHWPDGKEAQAGGVQIDANFRTIPKWLRYSDTSQYISFFK